MKRRTGDLSWRLRDAESLGYARGFADKHCEKRTFTTGAEYIAWLRGWRKGQAAMKAARAAAEAQQANTERIMGNLLREAA